MNKQKNGRLQAEIGIITALIFIAILIFTSLSNYFVTKNSFLNSKNEMIDRDLKNIATSTKELIPTDWFWSYSKEHAEDMTRPLTDKETEYSASEEFTGIKADFFLGERSDFEACDEDAQFLLARMYWQMLSLNLDYEIRELKYADISVLDFPNDHETYLYVKCTENEPNAMEELSKFDAQTAFSYSEAYKKLNYDLSEHTAVKQITDGKLSEAEETLYEVWSDPDDDKDYYIGYTPIIYEGEVCCYIRISYDWSTFRSDLIGRVIKTVLLGLVILVILNGLLILLIQKRATSPLSKVKNSVQTYMEDKDSSKVNEAMSSIKCRNEIGVLADSFSELATEIDRYTEENLRLGTEKERIATELSLATNIQVGTLPNNFPAFPERTEFEIYASMDPAKEVGGDFYDFFMIDDDHLAMVIADVSGKGVPAALFMMSSKILINDHALMGGTPAEILERVNKQVNANNDANMFVTVWLGILEISKGKLTTSSAGHEYPIININGRYELLKDKHGLAVGAMPKSKYKNTELTLKKGDSIFVYTDGVAEATDANDKLFGTDRTIEALNALPEGASQQEVLKGVRTAVDAFVKEAPQFDDLTMLGMKYNGPAPQKADTPDTSAEDE